MINQFNDFQIQLLLCNYISLERWHNTDYAAPHWRLYWNREHGALVHCNGHTINLDPANLYLIPPHTSYGADLNQSVHHFYIHFTLNQPFSIVGRDILSYKKTKAQHDLIDTLIAAISSRSEFNRQDTITLSSLLCSVLKELPADQWSATVTDSRIRQTLAFMEQHLDSPIDNKSLARAVALSNNAFIRLFSHTMGQSPQEYLLKRRIEKAAILLHNTDLTIEAIADACAFYDRSYFSRIFKRHFGDGPATYRKKRRIVTGPVMASGLTK